MTIGLPFRGPTGPAAYQFSLCHDHLTLIYHSLSRFNSVPKTRFSRFILRHI